MDSFLVYVIVGLLAGWLASRIMKNHRVGILGSLILGVLGAMVGGYIFEFIGLETNSLLGIAISALVGSIALLSLIQAFNRI
jgi:uncharacterized membrane protein YeaQ/YmgE (transglycosylase-associated protein family)